MVNHGDKQHKIKQGKGKAGPSTWRKGHVVKGHAVKKEASPHVVPPKKVSTVKAMGRVDGVKWCKQQIQNLQDLVTELEGGRGPLPQAFAAAISAAKKQASTLSPITKARRAARRAVGKQKETTPPGVAPEDPRRGPQFGIELTPPPRVRKLHLTGNSSLEIWRE